jgi:hypothetical protein
VVFIDCLALLPLILFFAAGLDTKELAATLAAVALDTVLSVSDATAD